jgi:Sec-independent protein translocase protein TatA
MIVAALDNPIDIAFLLVFAFLLFGKQLPEVARSLGKGIRELREGTNFSEVTEALNSVNQIRSAVTPTAIARAALPGVAEVQDTVGAAKDLVSPPAADAAEESATPSEPTAPAGPTAAPPLG